MRRVWTALFAVLVVAALTVTIVLGVMYWSVRATETAREDSLAAAREYVHKMFAWTPENVSDNVNFMMEHVTGQAKTDYEKQIIGEGIVEKVKEHKVSATVTDQGSGVIENTRDTSKVLLFINQSATRGTDGALDVNPSRVVYTMELRGGQWLINNTEIITDETLENLVAERDGTPPPVTSIPVSPPSSAAPESSVAPTTPAVPAVPEAPATTPAG